MKSNPVERILPEPAQDTLFFLLLLVMVVSMPLSSSLISSSQIAMGVLWLATGNYREKLQRLRQNRPALIFMGIFLVHAIGLLWTEDLAYGVFKSMRDKLPMLTLTLFVASARPMPRVRALLLPLAFSVAVVISSFVGFGIFLSGNYDNFRDLSPFISHFQFSLMMLITMFLLPWLTRQAGGGQRHMALAYMASAWLLFFIFVVSSLQAIVALGGVLVFLFIRYLFFGNNMLVRVVAAFVFLAVTATSVIVSIYMVSKVTATVDVDASRLDERTSDGNPYIHHFDNQLRENGHHVYYFIADGELREAWDRHSDYDYEGYDDAGNQLKYTLFRYMASKGLRKDREGLMSMTDADIRAVEKGTTNYLYNDWPNFLIRIHTTFWEIYWYRQTGNPTGHTLSQRLELWKAARAAIKHRPIFGWGTGDVFIAVEYGLDKIDSQLENTRMKPHNQYLLYLVLFGLTGSFVIYAAYFYFVRFSGAYRYFPFNIFLVVMMGAMIGNDPLDVQFGQTIFCFFSLYFGIIYQPEKGGDAGLESLFHGLFKR